jgi:hypothetical protein
MDRPNAIELVQAVREFLERDVMAATEGRVQFHTRVAINALGMVERELLESSYRDWNTADQESEQELAARIRAGADVSTADVRERVRRKLLVANPGYIED